MDCTWESIADIRTRMRHSRRSQRWCKGKWRMLAQQSISKSRLEVHRDGHSVTHRGDGDEEITEDTSDADEVAGLRTAPEQKLVTWN